MSPQKKAIPASKPASRRVAAIKKKPAVKKPTPKKPTAKRVVAPKKKVAVKKPAPKKAALPKKKPLPKKPVPEKKVVVKAATRKVMPKKKASTNKPAARKAPVKKIVATKPKLPKAAPRIQMLGKTTHLKKAVTHKAETEAPPQAATEWVGTSAMKAIPCTECGAKAGEMCISKETNRPIWESHPARIVAYTTSRLASRLILAGQQQAIGKR